MYKGICHFHSNYSYDSRNKIDKIIDFALKQNLNFLILTDHDTIKGSEELHNRILQRNLQIEVPLAAEYNTEFGDVIAVFLKEEIQTKKFELFLEHSKKQNAVLILPHPYQSHRQIEKIAKACDFLEIYNARCSLEKNNKAQTLCQSLNKKPIYGADAHNYKSLNHAIIAFEKSKNFRESLLTQKIELLESSKSTHFQYLCSQYVKSFKKKNFRLFYNNSKKVVKLFLKGKLFKSI